MKDKDGTTAVEFAMIAFPFFFIIFATIETSLIFVSELALDHGVKRVQSRIETGELQKNKTSESEFRSLLCQDASFIIDCSKVVFDLKSYDDYASVPVATPLKNGDVDSTGFGYALPAADKIAALRVFYKYPMHVDFLRKLNTGMADGSQLLAEIATFRTEAF